MEIRKRLSSQLEGHNRVERTSNMMRGIQTVYKEISFQDLQTSCFYK